MGTIPGPVIVFRFDQGGVSAAVDSAMTEVRAKTKATSEQVADDWRRMAAQIRAAVAQGALPEKDILSARQQIISTLGREVDLLRNRENLSNKELANLKAMTLELERQKSFRAGTGGITTGTANSLNQVSFQTVQGLERVIDSMVNRYLGGAAGALTRTVRDVGYYSAQAGGSGGIGGGLAALSETVGPATIALTGLVTALTAVSAIAGSITLGLAKENEQFENLAAVTGLTSQQVQVFNELAKESGLSAEAISTGIARLQGELGEYIRKGQSANAETIRFVAVAKELGVSVTDASGKLRQPIDILSDLSNALHAIPDNAQRSAEALDLVGGRNRELAALLLSSKGNLADLVNEIQKSGPIIGEGMASQLDRAKNAWDAFTRSVAASALTIKESIASGFLSATGIGNFGASNQPSLYQQAQKILAQPFTPGSIFLGTPQDNQKLIDQAQALIAGGQRAVEIEQKRKELNDAIKDSNGVLALSLAQQVKSLEDAQAIDNSRLEIAKKIREELLTGRANTSRPTRAPQTADQVLNQILNPLQAPNIGGLSTGTIDLSGILGTQSSATSLQLLKQINDEHDTLFTTQFQKDQEHYQQELNALNFALNQKLISQEQYNAASLQLSQNWAQTQAALNKKFISDADKLFDDLLSGNTKSFSKALEKDVEDIVTQPIRKLFDSVLGSLLGSLNQAINGGPSPTGGTGTSSAGSLGTIFGGATSIGSVIFNALGIRAGGAGTSTGTGGGQFGLATAAVYITANDVYVAGGLFGSSSSALGGGVSSFFGNNNPFGGGSIFFGNNSPFANAGFGGLKIPGIGGSSGTGIGGIAGGSLATILGGLLLGGLGGANNNTAQEAIGAGTTASGIVKALGAAGLIKNASLVRALGSGFSGAGLLAAGISQGGGVGGTLQDVAGGAQIGSIFGPLGSGIGAGVGALIGGLQSIFGSGGWSNQVRKAMYNQQIWLPPSENFSFASNGSIASTLGTGFSQSGSRLSQFSVSSPFYANAIFGQPLTNIQRAQLNQDLLGLNSSEPFLGFPGNNPFTNQPSPGNPLGVGNGPLRYSTGTQPSVNLHFNLPAFIDQGTASQVFQQLAPTIATAIAPHIANSSTGLARAARAAVILP